MTTKCPSCNQTFEVEASMNGQTAQCSACGNNFTITPLMTLQTAATSQANIPNYLWQSIVVTFLCCLPFGIVSIVNAAKVNTLIAQGNLQDAQKASDKARIWAWWAFGVGMVTNILAGIAQFGAAFAK